MKDLLPIVILALVSICFVTLILALHFKNSIDEVTRAQLKDQSLPHDTVKWAIHQGIRSQWCSRVARAAGLLAGLLSGILFFGKW